MILYVTDRALAPFGHIMSQCMSYVGVGEIIGFKFQYSYQYRFDNLQSDQTIVF